MPGYNANIAESSLFQWATHFNASTPARADVEIKIGVLSIRFQWATHFYAHSHERYRILIGSETPQVSMGYSLQRPLAQ
jgi:hypothetical protein